MDNWWGDSVLGNVQATIDTCKENEKPDTVLQMQIFGRDVEQRPFPGNKDAWMGEFVE